MKKSGINYSGITGKVTVEDEEFDVEFDALDCFISNDGIGGYECHGYRGFDSGQDYVEDFTLANLKVRSEEGNEVTDSDLLDKIRKEIGSSVEIAELVTERFVADRESERDDY